MIFVILFLKKHPHLCELITEQSFKKPENSAHLCNSLYWRLWPATVYNTIYTRIGKYSDSKDYELIRRKK